MSEASRALQPGAVVVTSYSGRVTHHRITHRRDGFRSQSRVGFLVEPPVPKSIGALPNHVQDRDYFGDAHIDADWFEPAP